MGVKDSFSEGSQLAKIAFIMLIAANFFNWIVFSTTGWGEDENKQSIGIWRICGSGSVRGCSTLAGSAVDWFVAFQAFSIFGFVLVNVAMALAVFFFFMEKFKGDKEVAIATAISGIAAGVCWLIAVIIFGAEYEDNSRADSHLEYSFGLAIVALILSVAGGVAMIFVNGGGATEPSG